MLASLNGASPASFQLRVANALMLTKPGNTISESYIAVLREKTSGKRYKLRQGEQIGRLRVTQIRAKDVVFTIQDFGYERQETLSLRKQEDVTQ